MRRIKTQLLHLVGLLSLLFSAQFAIRFDFVKTSEFRGVEPPLGTPLLLVIVRKHICDARTLEHQTKKGQAGLDAVMKVKTHALLRTECQ